MTPTHPAAPPDHIAVRGARVHNLQRIDVNVPLHELVGIAGVSGSGKSSLAMGVLYAEGSRRYLEALSTYTRRRLTQAARAAVDSVEHVPAALALRQHPGVPGVRSTFGTSTELLNVLRLMFSRLASHVCPRGHRVPPTLDVAAEIPFACPVCGARVRAPGAEALAFNAAGACPACAGTGVVRGVDDASLVPDTSKTIDEGAVAPWQAFGFNVQPDIVREFGVRTDVPYRDLTDRERAIVLDGPEEKKHIVVTSRKGVHELDFTFRNARLTVVKELERAADGARLKRVERFLTETVCAACAGTRLSDAARAPRIGGLGLAEVTAMTLDEVTAWAPTTVDTVPADMRPMAEGLVATLSAMARRLTQLGLGYLGLDRATATLSTGERQRAQLARAVRNRTTGVLYVLDEPSVGLHPANVDGLVGVMRDLVADGNSVVFVDHDVQVLSAADHLIEIGPGSGADGGRVVAVGTPGDVGADPRSRLGGFLTGAQPVVVRERASDVRARGTIRLATTPVHTVHALHVGIPRGLLTVVTGVSGSGKTTLVLESLVPALRADIGADGARMPPHVASIEVVGEGGGAGRVGPGDPVSRVHVVDAAPIGITVRSTVATYSGVMDELRRAFGGSDDARRRRLSASDFSYNTGSLRCPRCEGTGEISLDVQFLPDIVIPCSDCHGSRYAPQADAVRLPVGGGVDATPRGDAIPNDVGGSVGEGVGPTMPQLLALTAAQALRVVGHLPRVRPHLQTLVDLGLGYLTLSEATPALSGGEAQRLKLSGQLRRRQQDAVFVLDEPTVGLHPLDVRVLIGVLQRLVSRGATVVVVEHDLDLIANADWIIDMGPGGGDAGGRIVASGTVAEVAASDTVTGRYLRAHLGE